MTYVTDGFEAPLHRALTEQIMIMGVPREFALINGTMFAALLLGLHSLLSIPLALVVHVMGLQLAKSDPNFIKTFKRHLQQPKYFEV